MLKNGYKLQWLTICHNKTGVSESYLLARYNLSIFTWNQFCSQNVGFYEEEEKGMLLPSHKYSNDSILFQIEHKIRCKILINEWKVVYEKFFSEVSICFLSY